MTVLVTGGAGFVGSHLCERLLEEGHSVWALDNFDDFYDPGRKRKNLALALRKPDMHLVEGDIRDEILLDGLMSDIDFDAVVHLAALPGAKASVENPDLCYDVNVTGTLRLLESMRRQSIPFLFFGSDASVYGAASEIPFTETQAADRPLSPYAASKRAGEMLCHTYYHLYGLNVYCLRFFAIYGPRQRPDCAIYRLIRHLDAEEVLASQGDGSSRRDYVYIDDAVDAVVLALHRAPRRNGTRGSFEILNVGRNQSIRLDDLVAELAKAIDAAPSVDYGPALPGELNSTLASLERCQEILGYDPKTDLKNGLARFVEWYRKSHTPLEATSRHGSSNRPEEPLA